MAAKKSAAKKAPQKSAKKAAAKKPAAKKSAAKQTVKSEKKAAAKESPAAKKSAPAKETANKKVAAKKSGGAKSSVTTSPTGFVAKQRQRLLELRDELVEAMDGVTVEIRSGANGGDTSGSGMHQGDAGSDAYDRDFALSMLSKEQDALYEIDAALRRIDKGTYGICEMSGEKILKARLEAIPFARLTVECQAAWEKENGSQRFRPNSEIGFSNGMVVEDEESSSVSLDGDED
jgi:RNA polymerase-binding transcription factor DksA